MHAHDTPDGDDAQPIEPTPRDLDRLLDSPSGPDEPPARAIGSVTRFVHDVAAAYVEEAMREHLREHHGLKIEREWRRGS